MILYAKYPLSLKICESCDMFSVCEIKIKGTKVTHHSSTTYRYSFKDAAHMFYVREHKHPQSVFFKKKKTLRSREERKHLDAHIRQIKHVQINVWKPLCR